MVNIRISGQRVIIFNLKIKKEQAQKNNQNKVNDQ